MKFQDFEKIKGRLEKIYQIRKKWNRARGPFDVLSIKTRELFLIEQQILENYEKYNINSHIVWKR